MFQRDKYNNKKSIEKKTHRNLIIAQSMNHLWSRLFGQVINTTYRANLLKLKNFVMVLFNNDTIVEPKESEV